MENLIPPVQIAPEKPKEPIQRIKVLSPKQLIEKKRVVYQFEGRYKDSFGMPERIAKWFITGPSFSGKSSFTFGLCNYFTQFGKVDYNSLEEGDSQTAADKAVMTGLEDKQGLFRFLPKVPIPALTARLLKRNSAAFCVIDSVQHAELNRNEYIRLTDTLCVPRKGKSIVFINHWIKNDLTKFIKHDCDVKIEVIGYVAHVESRYGGNKPFIIWEDGARKHWGKKYKMVTDGRYWPGQKK